MPFLNTANNGAGAGDDAALLHRPRILFLHGGGTNARIFEAQCRALAPRLEPYLRPVFAEAPFASPEPGADVVQVYGDFGAYKRWTLGGPDAPEPDAAFTWRAVDGALARALRADDARGATGPVVAVLGFSQGAKVAASLLLRQQADPAAAAAALGLPAERCTLRFAVLMAGRGPLLPPNPEDPAPAPPRLALPTLHVLGRRDPGLPKHRDLLRNLCAPAAAELIEWDGDHRLPIKTQDVEPVVNAIKRLAADAGLISP